MSQARYVLATLSRLMSARLLYRVFYAGAVILISNYLIEDAALLDIFEVATASASIMMIASEVGMSMVVMRSGSQHSKERLQKYYGTALAIETFAWIALQVIVCGVYALSNGLTEMFWLLFILGIGQAFVQYRVVFRSIYRSLYTKEWITFIEVIDGMLKLAGTYFITRYVADLTMGIYSIAAWFTFTTFVFVAIYGLGSFKQVQPQFDKGLIKPMLSEGVWFSLQALTMTVYFEIDKVMLRLFQNMGWADIAEGDIGRYTAAARLVVFILIFHRIGLQVITPFLYQHYKENMDRYRRIVRISTQYLGALGIAMGVGMFVLADEIIQLLYKPQLWNAADALRVFAIFLIIRFIGITSSQIFATSQHQPLRTKLELLSVGINILLNIVCIPKYGFIGGAISTLVTETVFQIIMYVVSRRLIQDSLTHALIRLLPAVLAGIMMGAAIYYLKQWVYFLITIPIGVLLYTFLLYIFRFFSKQDLALLKKAKTN